MALMFEDDDGNPVKSWQDNGAWDNKARIYDEAIGRFEGRKTWLELAGFDVTNDSTICGDDAALVYYAYYFEDDQRDDWNGPGAEIEPN
jgi:hypothetical protein